jgi:hypothetical protein
MATAERKVYAGCGGRIDHADFGKFSTDVRRGGRGAWLVVAAGAPFYTAPLTHRSTASLIDLSIQRWSSSPKLWAVPPAGSRAQPDRRSVHAAPHVPREFFLSIITHLFVCFCRAQPP